MSPVLVPRFPPAHLQHLGIVPLDRVVEGGLAVVVGDVHLGMAVLHQLQQDLRIALAAGQVQGGAALLTLRAVGTAVGGGQAGERAWREAGRALRTHVQRREAARSSEHSGHAPAGRFKLRAEPRLICNSWGRYRCQGQLHTLQERCQATAA